MGVKEMTARELFGVAVRTFGLITLLPACGWTCMAMLDIIGGGPGNWAAMLIFSIPMLIVGTWMLRGAEPIVRFAYPQQRYPQHDPQRTEM